MRRCLSLLGFWLLCAGAALPDPARFAQPSKFPFRLTEGNLILIKVTAGSDIEGIFILDTGAGLHLLSKRFLARLQSQRAGRFTGFRHTGERLDFDLFRIPGLRIGRFRQASPLVGVWAFLDTLNIDGILSAKFFEHFVVTLDYKEKQLIFENQGSLARILRGERQVPLEVARDRDVSLDLFVDVLMA
jgi:hypothetical protein